MEWVFTNAADSSMPQEQWHAGLRLPSENIYELNVKNYNVAAGYGRTAKCKKLQRSLWSTSIRGNPGDGYAIKNENQLGKNEVWSYYDGPGMMKTRIFLQK